MRIGYADPPYIGCAHLYKGHEDYGGEVNHTDLIERLDDEFDGWVLHAAATAESMAVLGPLVLGRGARWCSWVKGFAAFKKNVSVAYAWEPVIIKPARKPIVSGRLVMRDWIQCSITLRKGLTGVKPQAVCHWAFELAGAERGDEFVDLFPGTGAVTRAWEHWQEQLQLPVFPRRRRNPPRITQAIAMRAIMNDVLKPPGPDSSTENLADALAAAQAEIAKLMQERDELISYKPTDRPLGERFLLNAYGRQCYDEGRKSAESTLAALRAALREKIEALPHAVWTRIEGPGQLSGELTSLWEPEQAERLVRLTDVLEVVEAVVGREDTPLSYTLCQRCDEEYTYSWNISQAEFHVGRIDRWKVQLCPNCLTIVEQAVLAALKATAKQSERV